MEISSPPEQEVCGLLLSMAALPDLAGAAISCILHTLQAAIRTDVKASCTLISGPNKLTWRLAAQAFWVAPHKVV